MRAARNDVEQRRTQLGATARRTQIRETWAALPDRPVTDGPAPRTQQTQSNTGAPQDLSVPAILGAHTQKFDDILRALQSVKSTLEPKIDALCIDMGNLREEHKKLKKRVTSMEGGVAEMRPPIATTTQHVRDLQREYTRGGLVMAGGRRYGTGPITPSFALCEAQSAERPQGGGGGCTQVAPTAEQASMERNRAWSGEWDPLGLLQEARGTWMRRRLT
ncbi:hypothetical protein NDU88_001828 [Pleurodeles waltl]|uniref:Uncharacterized protein n=1 Tax=Pleurodeles waltl TaxID=8319 RepID=A0AAV7W1F0_PLEWA|nr:hypothetical protein NDU88_001828 [Pleurodeles waltl]